MQIKNFLVDQNLKELTEHRTIVLPIACYETVINENANGFIPLHWHEEFQFVHIVKGEAEFRINEENVAVQEGEGLFINSSCLHMARDTSQSGCAYICLNISPSFVMPQELYINYVNPYIQATNISHIHLISTEQWANHILDSIIKINTLIKETPAFFEVDISMLIHFMWKNLIMNGIPLEYEQTEKVKSQRMKQMLDWIHQHFTEKIRLDDIARAGQISRSECCRYFQKILRTTPLNYVIDYRIQKSLLLLEQPESNVTDVAYSVGFNSTSYFIDRFKKSINTTPLAYKKQKSNNNRKK